MNLRVIFTCVILSAATVSQAFAGAEPHLRGVYAFTAHGTVFDGLTGTDRPAAMLGTMTFNGPSVVGSRVLTFSGSPGATPATFTCNIIWDTDGTGLLDCLVNEDNAPVPLRRDVWKIAVSDNSRELQMLFLSGTPLPGAPPGIVPIRGAVILGTAKQQ